MLKRSGRWFHPSLSPRDHVLVRSPLFEGEWNIWPTSNQPNMGIVMGSTWLCYYVFLHLSHCKTTDGTLSHCQFISRTPSLASFEEANCHAVSYKLERAIEQGARKHQEMMLSGSLQGTVCCQQPPVWWWTLHQSSFRWDHSPSWHLDWNFVTSGAEDPEELSLESWPPQTVRHYLGVAKSHDVCVNVLCHDTGEDATNTREERRCWGELQSDTWGLSSEGACGPGSFSRPAPVRRACIGGVDGDPADCTETIISKCAASDLLQVI